MGFDWIREFLALTKFTDSFGIKIVGVINTGIFSSLIQNDMRLGVDIIVEIWMAVEMIGFNAQHYGDVGRFFEIPTLKATHFVNHDIFFGNLIEFKNGGVANIADQMDMFEFFREFTQDWRNNGASSSLTFGASDANNWRFDVLEEIISNGGPIIDEMRRFLLGDVVWVDRRTAKN